MLYKNIKKYLSLFVLLTFVFVQCKTTVLSASDTHGNKSRMREFVSGYVGMEIEDHEWIKNNVPTIEKVAPNDLAIERLKEEKKMRGTVSAFSAGTLDYVLPRYVDNSLLKYFPPIGDQGALGSCAAFNTTYYQFTYTIAKANGWDVKNDSDNTKKFSPKWTFNLTNSGRNSSFSVLDSYRLFMDSGAAKWSDFEYISDDSDPRNYLEWPTDARIWREALNYRIEDYGYVEVWDDNNPDTPVKNPDSESLADIKQLLSNGHVLVFETNITGWRFTTVGNDPSTGYDDPFEGEYIAYACGKSSLPVDGHVMTLVGYNDDIWVDINGNGKVDSGEKGAFKVANSWGTEDVLEFSNTDFTWYSNQGFVWLSYDALNKVSAVEDCPPVPDRRYVWRYNNYAYWITPRTDYTPKFLVEYTMSTSNRYNVKVMFGFSNSDTNHPVSFWDPNAINKYSLTIIDKMGFDGTENECDATFVFDLTHLYEMYDNQVGNWYFSIIDEGAGNDGVLKELKFIDLHNEKEYVYQENIPYKFYNESVTFGPVKVEKDSLKSSGCILNRAMPFYERYFRTVSIDGKIYTVGGYQPQQGYINTVYEYDPDEDTWEFKTELPGETASLFHVTRLDEEIYLMRKVIEYNDRDESEEDAGEDVEGSAEEVVGQEAKDNAGENAGDDGTDDYKDNVEIKWIIEKYNPITDTWSFLRCVDCENVRNIVAFNNEIYIIEHNEVVSEKDEESEEDTKEDNEEDNEKDTEEDNKKIRIQKYNPADNAVITILEEDFNWSYFHTVVLNEEIYFIGGKKGRELLSGIGEGLGGYRVDNASMSYNLITKEWKEKTPLPEHNSPLNVVAFNDKIYAVIRYNNNNKIMYYHSGTDKWYNSEIKLMNRNGIRLDVSGNKMFVLGGTKNIISFIVPDTLSDAIEVINLDSLLNYGDVNQDGFIDSIDYTLIRRYVLGIITVFPKDVGMLAADVNRDGEINSSDYFILKNYILRSIDGF